MLVDLTIAKLLKAADYSYGVTCIMDSNGKRYNSVDDESFDSIVLYMCDLKELEEENGEEYFLVPEVSSVVEWLRTNYKLHVEVFINEEHNDYCCRCWSIASERNFKLLNTRVAYSSPYEAWIGILESTLKNYVIPKR